MTPVNFNSLVGQERNLQFGKSKKNRNGIRKEQADIRLRRAYIIEGGTPTERREISNRLMRDNKRFSAHKIARGEQLAFCVPVQSKMGTQLNFEKIRQVIQEKAPGLRVSGQKVLSDLHKSTFARVEVDNDFAIINLDLKA